jgi:hypothetical protein
MEHIIDFTEELEHARSAEEPESGNLLMRED